MKFGKTILSQQLPEYSAHYINYKALKKVIKSLAAGSENETLLDDQGRQQTRLQANKATFFFKLERELDKVNNFYLQKEAELRNRLNTLVEKRKLLQISNRSQFRSSANFIVLQEGFQQFERDLNKLQQYVELNATGFYKALKKWDKRSKSHTKELYLSRRVEIQPVFDRDVLSNLVDTVTAILLELETFASVDEVPAQLQGKSSPDLRAVAFRVEDDLDTDVLKTLALGNVEASQDIVMRLIASAPHNAGFRLTRIFMQALPQVSDENLQLLMHTGLIDLTIEDEISGRTCLHEAVLANRTFPMKMCLVAGSNLSKVDVYGRTALHYACLQSTSMQDIALLLLENSAPVDVLDHNMSSPLNYAVKQGNFETVSLLLRYGAEVNPRTESDYIPLSMACSLGHLRIAELLLLRGARILYNTEGLSPLHLVARAGHVGFCQILCQHDNDLEARDKFSGWTPVFYAASEGHIEVLRELIHCGALVDIRDEDHHSPTYYAAWEGHNAALQLLLNAGGAFGNTESSIALTAHPPKDSSGDEAREDDGIPSLILPPPILPVRSYGHNYLDRTTFLQISLVDYAGKHSSVEWYLDATLFSSSKLSLSLKSMDKGSITELIPYTVSLPILDDLESFTFQLDDLKNVCLEFEIYPTFGSKIIAKGVTPPNLFNDTASARINGNVCVVPLLDPRLQCIGQICFEFTTIKPFSGLQFDIHSRIDTYWKSTQTIPNSKTGSITQQQHLVTESSLSGQYLWIPVQVSKDNIPFVCPTWRLPASPINISISEVNSDDVEKIVAAFRDRTDLTIKLATATHLADLSGLLHHSYIPLEEFLLLLQIRLQLHLQIIIPTTSERRHLAIAGTADVNLIIDSILSIVFNDAERIKDGGSSISRSIFFSSSNSTICTALNWKQPNYPVFLSSNLGPNDMDKQDNAEHERLRYRSPHGLDIVDSDQRCSSLKAVVKFSKVNNLLGIIIDAQVALHAPALIATIKQSGLILITHGFENDRRDNVDMQTLHGVDGIQNSGICRLLHGIDT